MKALAPNATTEGQTASHGMNAVRDTWARVQNRRMSAEPGSDERWATVQADDGGQPLIVRIRIDVPKQELQARWPNRMVVLWQFPPGA